MVDFYPATSCCGATEVSGVCYYNRRKPEKWWKDFHDAQDFEEPILVFFDNNKGGGKYLASFIRRHRKFGKVVVSSQVNNKGSKIRGYLWTPPDDIKNIVREHFGFDKKKAIRNLWSGYREEY